MFNSEYMCNMHTVSTLHLCAACDNIASSLKGGYLVAKKDDETLVRKAVFVPPALWQRVRVEAAERDIDLSDIFTEMLQERYEATSRNEESSGARGEQSANKNRPALIAA